MNRVIVGGIVKNHSGGCVFKITCVDEEQSNIVKDTVVKTLVLSGIVCTVENAMYDKK